MNPKIVQLSGNPRRPSPPKQNIYPQNTSYPISIQCSEPPSPPPPQKKKKKKKKKTVKISVVELHLY